jgi:hypothetical protein
MLLFATVAAPDWSGSPEVAKAIFSRYGKATRGSYCQAVEKKLL